MENEALTRQERLLPFLTDPKSYPDEPEQVRLVQTHCSFVFIAGGFVYKVKKAVNFGFLDFSTLEKHRHFCEREIELNRRLTSDVYLEVLTISKTPDGFTFGEGGEVVEYAVKMRRLSDEGFLNKQVERGEAKPEDFDRIAARLKNFYLAQHPADEVENQGRVDVLKISTDENFQQIEPFIGKTISPAAFETVRFFTNEFYRRHADLFASRVRNQWIRDCHGDLHLDHIHLTPDALNIYDCIEFNDRFRYIDVANDVAFLAMDLDYEARPDLARHFVTRMSDALGDREMLQLIDFYKCYRAVVRGKVESLRDADHAASEEEKAASAERARRYFRLALQYAVSGSRPMALIVMGRIGSGKSTLARAISDELGWNIFSSDQVRKELAGVPVYKRADKPTRSRLYTAAMTEKTYGKLYSLAEAEISAGRCVILDATFAEPEQRAELKSRFKSRDIPLRFVEARVDDEIVKERLTKRGSGTDEMSDARLEDFEMLSELYQPPGELTEKELLHIDTKGTVNANLWNALKALAEIMVCH